MVKCLYWTTHRMVKLGMVYYCLTKIIKCWSFVYFDALVLRAVYNIKVAAQGIRFRYIVSCQLPTSSRLDTAPSWKHMKCTWICQQSGLHHSFAGMQTAFFGGCMLPSGGRLVARHCSVTALRKNLPETIMFCQRNVLCWHIPHRCPFPIGWLINRGFSPSMILPSMNSMMVPLSKWVITPATNGISRVNPHQSLGL